MISGWDSKRMIGKVRVSFVNFKQRKKMYGQDPEWIAYYNGWLEGRGDMLIQMIDDAKEEAKNVLI